ncbi:MULTISPECIES: Hha/YmoA family nucleoid-associated regulatory protein [Tenebrionibacter/Tenebrionicola group]|jgi:hypothetical protein|uniref:Uncharacterized protein n=2 Tax=Tenebrionibacter/Tenebrionicola group TaxID=2969848 RepID=A0A8K0V586_9ENTR|nr:MULTISPECIES: Hha/YmoA family nucleoid-associated regulatory protein [Tenebrionibacter/Tenebrionicola group]MBK4715648.1 hypothetical protein [Tenebrionibacter intestinalis]MBV4412392.1 hypothetical protein [Tenebrionicola larvae]MBV5096401.1 hypothetical protein [Tenebrionicola larvae]
MAKQNKWKEVLARIGSVDLLEKIIDRKSRELEGDELNEFLKAAEQRQSEMIE